MLAPKILCNRNLHNARRILTRFSKENRAVWAQHNTLIFNVYANDWNKSSENVLPVVHIKIEEKFSCYALPRPNTPVPKHHSGCSNINATLPLCIFTFSYQLCIFPNISLPRCPSSVLIKHHPGPCFETYFCPESTLQLYSILLQRNLPQSASTPTQFCPNTLLFQRPLSQSASAPMPSGSTHSASKCLKFIVLLLKSPLWPTYFCPNTPLLQRPLQQRSSAPMLLCPNVLLP